MSCAVGHITQAADVDRFCETSDGIQLCYRTSGDPAAQPLLLIAGLSLHLTSWPQAMVDGLLARGFFVIRFDNRDVGCSTHTPAKPPGRLRQAARLPRRDGYDLADMARDAVGLLDHLEIEQADLVGMSMGGMIAQTIAAQYPDRTRSLTSIFSTTGHRGVGQPAASSLWHLMKPGRRSRDHAVARHVKLARHIAGFTFPIDVSAERAYAADAWDRGSGPKAHHGVARQIGAIAKSGDRTEQLRRITAPTLVIHGDTDPMVHPSGGHATAAAIQQARHIVITGMAHHLAAFARELVDLITDHAHRTSGDNQ